jgi:hypothetical protein
MATEEKKTALAVIEPSAFAPLVVSDEDVSALREQLDGQEPVGLTMLDKVKVPSGGSLRWAYGEDEEGVRELVCIIAHKQEVRRFWEGKFGDGSGNKPPACEGHFDREAKAWQGSAFGACDHCKLQRAKDGCKNQMDLFLMFPGDALLPTWLVVPPGSIQEMKKFMMQLAFTKRVPHYGCIVGLSLEKKKSQDGIDFSAIKPRFISALSKEQAARMKQFSEAFAAMFSTRSSTAAAVPAGDAVNADEDDPFGNP